MTRNRLLLVLMLAALGCSQPVLAQWQWIDKDGRRVFSDRAPPHDIPPKNILRQPGAARPTPADAVVAGAAPSPAGAAEPAQRGASAPLRGEDGRELAVPRLSAADRELAERKKQADAAAAAKKQADEERNRQAKADICTRAKGNKALIESGVRIAQAGANGERVILDDAGRAAELQRIKATIDSNCN